MRLTSIKLSGFKSFAEPTTFPLPGQLVGVVGPNGCGKSNIMDAVRWVLGESRAGELRGGSMQDVIFNGTGTRKPAGRASVELVFDNQDGRAGGSWSRYAEIAVKRVLARAGGSSYYLNNQQVRRRDVHDVFLGTGLGPRAYAIIGQGMIGRIIESRPEELRAFLEEAAGVSKYKERRRETENRLASARENLARVGDLVRELDAGVRKLQRQAEAAARWQRLQAERQEQQNRLFFLEYAQADAAWTKLQGQVERDAAALAERGTARDAAQAQVESRRGAQEQAAAQLAAAQARLYEAAAERARHEAQLRTMEERRTRASAQLAQVATQRGRWQGQRADAAQALEALQAADADAQARLQVLQRVLQADEEALTHCRAVLARAQARQRTARSALAHLREQASGQAAEQRALEQQRARLAPRAQQLQREQAALPAVEPLRLAQLQAALAAAQAEEAQAEQATQAGAQASENAAQALRALQERLGAQERDLAQVRARLQALQEVQRRLDAADGLAQWRSAQGLGSAAELWRSLQVEPGWEPALEAVLRERALAQPAPGDEVLARWRDTPPPVTSSFYARAPAARTSPASARPARDWPRLRDRVTSPDAAVAAALDDWCAGCYTAASWAEAVALRADLAADEEVVVAAGHRVTRSDVRFHAPPVQRSGFLVRGREMAALEAQAQAQGADCLAQKQQVQAAESAHKVALTAQQRAQEALGRARTARRSAEVAALGAERDAELARERGARLARDLREMAAEQAALQARLQALAQATHARQAESESAAADDTAITQAVQDAERALEAARAAAGGHRREQQELQYALRAGGARRADLQRALETAVQQLGALDAEQAQAEAELRDNADAAARAELTAARAAEAACTAALAAARGVAEEGARALRAADEERLRLERLLEPQREQLAALRLAAQAAQLRRAEQAARLQEAGADLAALQTQPPGEREALQQALVRLDAAIAACGAVNLAALEELGGARARQAELQRQSADLTEAVATLEQAIRTIDAESRALLTQTFQEVNAHFGALFPELFGGGHAELQMTAGEVLESGVQVMAQPPGKKNQSIHLLSGGEKALTAIALVFAIFELNPAPFCLLDEVDAPLDDANTARYAALVRKMSARGIQFLFISHNRIAMEYAEQLIGVTMAEEGVSRIVSVDLERALEYAHAQDEEAHATS